MVSVLASLTVGAALAGAAGMKAADPTGSAVGLGTYGMPTRRVAVWALIGLEGIVAVFALAGAAWPALVLLCAFAVGQAVALAAGRGGAACGCGGRGRLTAGSLLRTVALAGVGAIASSGEFEGMAPAIALGAAGAAFALGAWSVWRARPPGALDIAGEGPEIGGVFAVGSDYRNEVRTPPGPRVLLFTSEACRLCRRLRGARLGVPMLALDEERDAAAWEAANVPGAPYAIVLDEHGRVRAKGTPNTRRQLASLLRAAEPTALKAAVEVVPAAASRRTFLHRAAAAASALAAGGAVKPGDADAFHFCGHIYTTDGCPHPTGLPRIDSKGFPLRAADGRRVDDLGRLVDIAGLPVDEEDNPLLDSDGNPLPPATRTRVCTATAERYGITARVDGSWYRCCGGHVRKLVDCCTTGRRRINGDRALRGYCYGKRKVFCVMYYQTRIPC